MSEDTASPPPESEMPGDEGPLDRGAIEARLDAIGLDAASGLDLGETALLLAALDRPRVGLGRYRRHLATLAHDTTLAASGATTVEECVAALVRVIVDGHSYAGDTQSYDDMQNANLMRVIDRRRGLPVALGIIYAQVARSQGWDLVGLNFPGHFLVRIEAMGGRAILDPFGGGAILDANALRALLKRMGGDEAELDRAYYEAVADRDVLMRLQNNIKLRALQAEDFARAAEVVRSMLRINRESAALWHELGAFEAQTGNLGAAIAALETCIQVSTDPVQRQHVALALQKIRSNLN